MRHLYIYEGSFDQDRLGTNIGKALKKEGRFRRGGNATKVNCNGPNHAQMMSDIYFGKALSSKELYKQIQETCSWPADDLDTGAVRAENKTPFWGTVFF